MPVSTTFMVMRHAQTSHGAGNFLLAAGYAWADRAVTEDERGKLMPSVAAEGCSGGKLSFDDGIFGVEDAKWSDGKSYDLTFDSSFKVIGKGVED
ncbi:MAG TPA: hypothetical protein VFG05_00885 [Methylocella sp.]|nr:hypothetical protein [Methylocella sp.]